MISMPPADEFDQGPISPALPEKLMKELFSLAGWFLQAEPWLKMYDSHTIVIVDPETGDRQLAVVMGNAGTLFAIHLYQPEEGTRWYSNMHLGGESPLALHNAQFDHRYLEIQWSDGSELDEHDEVLDDCFAPDDWFDDIMKITSPNMSGLTSPSTRTTTTSISPPSSFPKERVEMTRRPGPSRWRISKLPAPRNYHKFSPTTSS